MCDQCDDAAAVTHMMGGYVSGTIRKACSLGTTSTPDTWQLAVPLMGMQSVTSSPPYSAGNWQGRPVTDSRVTLVAAEQAGRQRVGAVPFSWHTVAGCPLRCCSGAETSHPMALKPPSNSLQPLQNRAQHTKAALLTSLGRENGQLIGRRGGRGGGQ